MKKLKNLIKNKFCLALFAGALCVLSLAPFYVFIAAIISISLLFFLLEESKSKKEVFLLGFAYGFGYFLAGIYWISISLLVDAKQFAWLIPFSLTLIPAALALYFAIFALLYKKITEKFSFFTLSQKAVIFALLWLIFEVLRSYLFTGFPWNLIGYSLLFSENLSQIADIFGIFGLSFFAILICLAPIFLVAWKDKKIVFNKPSREGKIYCVFILILLCVCFVYGQRKILQYDKILAESQNNQKIRLVQANIAQDLKWDAKLRYENFISHIDLTNSKSLENVVAVVWSETSVPYIINEDKALITKIQEAVPDNGVLITGALRAKFADARNYEISEIFNSTYVFDKKAVVAVYDKHHLVPFGEYVPLAKFLPFLDKITGGGIPFSEGQGVTTIKTENFSFSPLICYEGIFTNNVVDRNNLPDLMVNTTNDAWFGTSSGPYQHFDMTKMRAIEHGIPLIRVANTGVSAAFDAVGRVNGQIDLNESGIVDVDFVKALIEPTIYTKFGFLPLISLVILVIFCLFLRNVTAQTKTNR